MAWKLPREFYIPKKSVKVAAKTSSAVAYIYTAGSRPAAALFVGKQAKPIWHFSFTSEAARSKKIAESFASAALSVAYKTEQKAKRKAGERVAVVGSIFRSSWGYDQTNVNYYEVVALVGSKSVKVKEIAGKMIETQSMAGQTIPLPGSFLKNAKEQQCLAIGESIKISECQTGFLMKPKMVGTIPVYESSYVSWYA